MRQSTCLPTPVSPTPILPTLDQKVVFRLLITNLSTRVDLSMSPSSKQAVNFLKCALILVQSKLSISGAVTNVSIAWLWEWLWTNPGLNWSETCWWLGPYPTWKLWIWWSFVLTNHMSSPQAVLPPLFSRPGRSKIASVRLTRYLYPSAYISVYINSSHQLRKNWSLFWICIPAALHYLIPA